MRYPLHRTLLALASLALASVVALGCAAETDTGGSDLFNSQCYSDAESCIDGAGAHHTFIVDSVEMPRSAGEARNVALDLDGDDIFDNNLGRLLSSLSAIAPIDVPTQVNEWLADGTLMILVDVQATDLASATSAGGRIFAGTNASPAPCASATDPICGHHLLGGATAELDPTVAVDATLAGEIAQGRFSSMPAPASFVLDLPELFPRPVSINLASARTENAVNSQSLDGIAGGAITIEEIHGSLYPAIVELTAQDCTGTSPACCVPDSIGESFVKFLDHDKDCQITVEDMKNDTLLAAVVAPDLDLLDSDGDYVVGGDGVKESMSLGVRFTAVPASFSPR